jgi:hypothetical protein
LGGEGIKSVGILKKENQDLRPLLYFFRKKAEAKRLGMGSFLKSRFFK